MGKKKKNHRHSRSSGLLSFTVPLPGMVRIRIEELLTDKRPDAALKIIEEWLEKRPDHPLLSFYAGSAHAMQGEPGTALRYFRTAYRGDRRNEALLNNLLYLYLELGFTTHALRILKSYLKTELAFEKGTSVDMNGLRAEVEKHQRETAAYFGVPWERFEEAHYWDEECQIAQREGDWSDSIAAANKALALLPGYPPALNNRAMSYYFTGRLEEAIADEERALVLHPKNVHALTNLVRFHYFQGEQAAVESYFRRLQALSPEDWAPQSNPIAKMMEAYAVAGTHQEIYAFLQERAAEEPGRGYYMLGAAAANRGDHQEARRIWKKMADDGSGWKQLAKDALKALADGKPGLGRADHFPYLLYQELVSGSQVEQLLEALKTGDDDDPAKQRQVRELAARHPGLLAAARWLLWYGPRASEGIQLLGLLGTEPAFTALREFALGQAGTDQERMEALQRLSQAGQLPADRPTRLWVRGEWREILLKQFEISDEAAQADYGDEVLELLGQAGQTQKDGNLDEAERIYQRILEQEPRCTQAYNNLASIAEKRGDLKSMRAYLEKTLEIDPDYVMGRCNLAHLALGDGDLERAEELVKPILDRDRFAPFEMKAYQLVQAYIQIQRHDLEAAAGILELLTGLYPDDPQVEVLAKQLEKLQPIAPLLARFKEQNREKHDRDDAHPLDADASLETCLDRYSKDPLKVTARRLGLSSRLILRKQALLERIAARLRDSQVLAQHLSRLPASALEGLDYLLERGGAVPWTEFSGRFGNDRDESPYWQYTEPKTTMGILRLAGLLFVGFRQGEQWVQVPAELRSLLIRLRRKDTDSG